MSHTDPANRIVRSYEVCVRVSVYLAWLKTMSECFVCHVTHRLVDGRGRPAGLIGWAPHKAVTFTDNHDTG